MPKGKALWSVLKLALQPARHLRGIGAWYPLVLAVVASAVAAVGLTVPERINLPRPWAVALFFAVVSGLFLRAAYVLRVAQLRPFPDLAIQAKHPIVLETKNSVSYPGERETPVMIGVRVTNEDTKTPAIVSFGARLKVPELDRGASLKRSREKMPGVTLPDDLRLEAPDVKEGEVAFVWSHSRDYVFRRAVSEDDVRLALLEDLVLEVTEHVSRDTVRIGVPGSWPQRQWLVALACIVAAAFMGGWPVPP